MIAGAPTYTPIEYSLDQYSSSIQRRDWDKLLKKFVQASFALEKARAERPLIAQRKEELAAFIQAKKALEKVLFPDNIVDVVIQGI